VATNVGGTLNVLEAARSLEIGRLVHTSTSEVYGTARTVPINEGHPLQAQSPYAASKIAADKIAESFHLSFGTPVVTLRPFNTFGPRQSTRAVIPTIITQLVTEADTVRLGSATPTRDFTFVEDTVAAFIAVGRAPSADVVGRVFNAGTGTEISIGELAARIAGLIGRSIVVAEDEARVRPADSEVQRLVCDSSLLREATGWSATHTLDGGLRATIAWFSQPDNLARYRVHEYQR
jgi:UDP-glucose 4-epimerase